MRRISGIMPIREMFSVGSAIAGLQAQVGGVRTGVAHGDGPRGLRVPEQATAIVILAHFAQAGCKTNSTEVALVNDFAAPARSRMRAFSPW